MKHIIRIINVLGFAFQYGVPIYTFSSIFPFVHGSTNAGLTKAGIFAIGILLLILTAKLKDKIKALSNKTLKECLLSIFPVLFWIIGLVVINAVQKITVSIDGIWMRMIIYIVIGRLLYITAAVLTEKEVTNE